MRNAPEHSKRLSPFVGFCLLTSVTTFGASLSQNTFYIDRPGGAADAWCPGLANLCLGWILVPTGVVAWLANPLLLMAWSSMLTSSRRTQSLILSIVSFVLAASFLFHSQIIASGTGTPETIMAYGLGYWLWLTSMAFAVVGSIGRVMAANNIVGTEEQSLPTWE
jgi:hypothetical protein